MKTFKDLIKENRRRLGMTTKRLALYIGVSQQYVNQLEIGKEVKYPSTKILARMVQILSWDKIPEHLLSVSDQDIKGIKREAIIGVEKLDVFTELAFSALGAQHLLSSIARTTPAKWDIIDDIIIEKEENSADSDTKQNEVWILSEVSFILPLLYNNPIIDDALRIGTNIVFFIPIQQMDISLLEEALTSIRKRQINQVKDREDFYKKDAAENFARSRMKHIEIYQISNIAFMNRLKIKNPFDEKPDSKYLIGGTTIETAKAMDIPQDIAVPIIKNLTIILNKGRMLKGINETAEIPGLSTVARIFPST